MSTRKGPKFKVGQVVMACRKHSIVAPMLIENCELCLKSQTGKEEFRYLGSNLFVWESDLRLLTKREVTGR